MMLSRLFAAFAALTLTTSGSVAHGAAPAEQPAPRPLELTVFGAGAAGFHVTSTLIAGEHEAVLVDAQFTLSEAHRLAAMILESGRKLTTIVVTHAHPDHFFGAEVLLRQFPDAKLVAAPAVAAQAAELAPSKLAEWKPAYGANLTDAPILPEALPANELVLEGREIRLVPVDGGESEFATAVYVPSAKTLIAGDLVFDKVHLWLAEGRPDQWLRNLASIASIGPIERVIAGHKAPGADDTPELFERNAEYIRSVQQIVATSATPEEALARVTERYPDYALPVIADIAVKALMAR